MKKWIAVALALMLCALSLSAIAEPVQIIENAESFDLSVITPEGYTLGERTMENDLSITHFVPDDIATMPELSIVMAFSEEYDGLSLTKDMSDEDIKTLFGHIDDAYNADDYTIGTTDDGWKFLQLVDNEEENGYAAFIMIHDGYFIETTVVYDDFRSLKEADWQRAIALLDSFLIADTAK